MKKRNYLILLLLILAIIVGALVGWKILSSKKTPPIPTLPTPIPESKLKISTPTPTFSGKGRGDSPEELLDTLKEKFPLIEFIPYQTDEFSINYQAPLHLKIEIKITAKKEVIKQKALDWIQSKGVNPDTHQIDWITPEL